MKKFIRGKQPLTASRKILTHVALTVDAASDADTPRVEGEGVDVTEFETIVLSVAARDPDVTDIATDDSDFTGVIRVWRLKTQSEGDVLSVAKL